VREAMQKRQDTAPLDEILVLDAEHRRLLTETDALRAKHKAVSRQIGQMKEKPAGLLAEMRKLGDDIRAADEKADDLEAHLKDLLLRVPNIPDASVPVGKDSSANVVLRTWGKEKGFPFKPLPHWELGERLGIIDFERGAKLSGSRFYVLKARAPASRGPSSRSCCPCTLTSTDTQRFIRHTWSRRNA